MTACKAKPACLTWTISLTNASVAGHCSDTHTPWAEQLPTSAGSARHRSSKLTWDMQAQQHRPARARTTGRYSSRVSSICFSVTSASATLAEISLEVILDCASVSMSSSSSRILPCRDSRRCACALMLCCQCGEVSVWCWWAPCCPRCCLSGAGGASVAFEVVEGDGWEWWWWQWR